MFTSLKVVLAKSDTLWRFILHILTGAISVCVHYSIMSLLLSLGAQALLASGVGFFFGAVTRFVTAYFHVFTPTSSIPDTLPKFLIALVAQGSFNLVLLDVFLYLNIQVWLSQIITTVMMTFLNFIVYRIWVFK